MNIYYLLNQSLDGYKLRGVTSLTQYNIFIYFMNIGVVTDENTSTFLPSMIKTN